MKSVMQHVVANIRIISGEISVIRHTQSQTSTGLEDVGLSCSAAYMRSLSSNNLQSPYYLTIGCAACLVALVAATIAYRSKSYTMPLCAMSDASIFKRASA